jgi:hypothetical protein
VGFAKSACVAYRLNPDGLTIEEEFLRGSRMLRINGADVVVRDETAAALGVEEEAEYGCWNGEETDVPPGA